MELPDISTFLCLRRGVSSEARQRLRGICFSLPTQRCFQSATDRSELRKLFSAYAEVFPPEATAIAGRSSFLCLRRGVSSFIHSNDTARDFSLPTQRCFRGCQRYRNGYWAFLCLRRGVSFTASFIASFIPFSLPTQRCFCRREKASRHRSTFLCLRRGVSLYTMGKYVRASFSLPTQRCFSLHAYTACSASLFSAYAEVFPKQKNSGL